ncbi:MAG TPA: LmbZ [Lachnospiraceae bacterium]|nr:Gfo/Idh/MocA family oxidoreductase [Lachnospiraceae bacterium]HAV01169.1 LmbZ [Lachnospiraceae bacterium]
MKVGIVGCGLIGNKRANAIKGDHDIVALCDTDIKKAERLKAQRELSNRLNYGKEHTIFVTTDYRELCERDLDIVIVSTLNAKLSEITLYAVSKNKHVIVEKPASIHSEEILPILETIRNNKAKVKVGFNHRYHPALLKAHEIFDSGVCGPVMFIRGRYGHGGRIGYDREWRADVSLSGGGETIDQGVHLIDLARWFMGDFDRVDGFAATYYWDMPVDDNGFIALRKADGRAAWLQVSCTEWKNMFSFEIYCRNAKLQIEGLGGSYGVETLKVYQMLPEMGPPDTTIYEYPRGDVSWEKEFDEFVCDIVNDRPVHMGDIEDAYKTLKIVETIYANSDLGRREAGV